MQSGPFPPRISRIGTEEEEGRPEVVVAIEGRASAVAARPSLANDPFPSPQGESGRRERGQKKRKEKRREEERRREEEKTKKEKKKAKKKKNGASYCYTANGNFSFFFGLLPLCWGNNLHSNA